MSRSTRKPYVTFGLGKDSRQPDRTRANRELRRYTKQVVATTHPEELVLPIAGDTRWSNSVVWASDGGAHWCGPDAMDYAKLLRK